MIGFFKNLMGGHSLRSLESRAEEILSFEPEFAALSEEALTERSMALRKRVREGETLDKVLPEAFALVREAANRTLRQRPYDVQLIGGMVLHEGSIAEMATGEGKTLAAVAPAYLNALSGEGVHVVTVNEYLARRDAVWMGKIYRALGLTVACLVPNAAYLFDPEWHIPETAEKMIEDERETTGSFLVQQEFLRPAARREAYLADITYGTNHEFGFDYLRDNLAYTLTDQVQRGHHYAIIDEVDSILIDEARTPLIIAAPDTEASDAYRTFARIASRLLKDEDYAVDEKIRSVAINDHGIEKVEKVIGVRNIYAPENLRLVHFLEESLKAIALYHRDKEYVVKNGEIVIVDEFTGRLLYGRRYNGGLHQAIEAKEGVHVKEESKTYAKISIQNYFRLYKKIAGMTGTAQTSAEEFYKVYNLEVVTIPTHRPLIRKDLSDMIYKNKGAKWEAVVKEIKEAHDRGQPVLVGTTSIEKNEHVSALLLRSRVPHEVLNAKNNEREGAIIAQAGKVGAVTVATNMAGRGVDIILGGNPPEPEEAVKIRELGGLYVVGTERHEARRIDNQLRGRSGRQGDPGVSRFFLSLDDDLLRIFGGEHIQNMMERFHIPDDQPIEMSMVSRAVAQAQSKVEGANFDLRKHLLEYDDVLNKQRDNVYRKRQEMLVTINKDELTEFIFEVVWEYFSQTRDAALATVVYPEVEESRSFSAQKLFEEAGILTTEHPWPESERDDAIEDLLRKRSREIAGHPQAINRLLGIIDLLWLNHLEDLEALSESVGLRAYGQKDPLVEYRRESHNLFKTFWANFNAWVFGNLFKMLSTTAEVMTVQPQSGNVIKFQSGGGGVANNSGNSKKVGRNDPCPCGSGKKYKKCHGK